jgi:hypothetical protein
MGECEIWRIEKLRRRVMILRLNYFYAVAKPSTKIITQMQPPHHLYTTRSDQPEHRTQLRFDITNKLASSDKKAITPFVNPRIYVTRYTDSNQFFPPEKAWMIEVEFRFERTFRSVFQEHYDSSAAMQDLSPI